MDRNQEHFDRVQEEYKRKRAHYRDVLSKARQQIRMDTQTEEYLMRAARDAGFTYTDIARWIGVTETAVRLRFKRRGWNQ